MRVRGWQVAAAATAAVFVLAPPAAARERSRIRPMPAPGALEQAVLHEVNALRRRHHLRPLRPSPRLVAAARAHSLAMAAHGFFEHDSSDGTPFWRRIERYYGSAGYAYWSVGENLLWASSDVGAAEAVRRWLASRPHRRNLLERRWREIGLAAVRTPRAPGSFRGLEVVVLTAAFGVRR